MGQSTCQCTRRRKPFIQRMIFVSSSHNAAGLVWESTMATGISTVWTSSALELYIVVSIKDIFKICVWVECLVRFLWQIAINVIKFSPIALLDSMLSHLAIFSCKTLNFSNVRETVFLNSKLQLHDCTNYYTKIISQPIFCLSSPQIQCAYINGRFQATLHTLHNLKSFSEKIGY